MEREGCGNKTGCGSKLWWDFVLGNEHSFSTTQVVTFQGLALASELALPLCCCLARSRGFDASIQMAGERGDRQKRLGCMSLHQKDLQKCLKVNLLEGHLQGNTLWRSSVAV